MRYLTTGQAAEKLGVTRAAIWQLCATGVIPAKDFSRPGAARKNWRVSEDVVQRLADRPDGTPLNLTVDAA